MSCRSQIQRDSQQWATFRFNANVPDIPEPYRSLVLERQRIQDNEDRIHLRKSTGGRTQRIRTDHAVKEGQLRVENFKFDAVLNRARVILAQKVGAKCTAQEFHQHFRITYST